MAEKTHETKDATVNYCDDCSHSTNCLAFRLMKDREHCWNKTTARKRGVVSVGYLRHYKPVR